ncbi:DUF5343 domain-containing protein [Patescibacteria group bacterium]|nr:DUF5343 domain-containing protein [Patescibacteria group bacterium]
MQNTTDIQARIKPPYVPLSKLIETFRLLSTRSFSSFGPSDLTNRGFSKTDAFQSVSALKFLGFVDEANRTNDLSKLHLKGDERSKAILEIVKKSYTKIFETIPEANKLPKNELYNEFVALYNLSPRLANPSVSNFLWLCNESGLEVSEQPIGRKKNKVAERKTKITNKIPEKRDNYAKREFTGNTHIIEAGNFQLLLPKTSKIMDAVYNGEFKEIRDKLVKLSDELKDEEKILEG